jgi:hypothetical protein
MPSSMLPSQSSSMLLQISVPEVPGMQVWGTPLMQACTVRWQGPAPQLVVPKSSSIWLSQSLSAPSQTSVEAIQDFWTQAPKAHSWSTGQACTLELQRLSWQ